jgi:hypothetical protein
MMVSSAGRQRSVDGKPRIGSFDKIYYLIHKPIVVSSCVIRMLVDATPPSGFALPKRRPGVRFFQRLSPHLRLFMVHLFGHDPNANIDRRRGSGSFKAGRLKSKEK